MENLKATLALRAFGFTKVPLLFMVAPSVMDLTDDRCEVKIPLNRLTRNHLKSMYFGTLAIGADGAGGLMALHHIWKTKQKVDIVFKSFKADFLKRPTSDVHFICEDGPKIARQLKTTISKKIRTNQPITITAVCPKISPEPVAKFVLEISMKLRS